MIFNMVGGDTSNGLKVETGTVVGNGKTLITFPTKLKSIESILIYTNQRSYGLYVLCQFPNMSNDIFRSFFIGYQNNLLVEPTMEINCTIAEGKISVGNNYNGSDNAGIYLSGVPYNYILMGN